jgi:Flp pilus assembly protein TadB
MLLTVMLWIAIIANVAGMISGEWLRRRWRQQRHVEADSLDAAADVLRHMAGTGTSDPEALRWFAVELEGLARVARIRAATMRELRQMTERSESGSAPP